jgi:hypothetical protein
MGLTLFVSAPTFCVPRENFLPFSFLFVCAVGRNGSGKSNIYDGEFPFLMSDLAPFDRVFFFSAIQFVLSDKHSNLGAEGREKMLHVRRFFSFSVFENTNVRLRVVLGGCWSRNHDRIS